MALALHNEDIPAALSFASASSKLVGIALRKGMKTNQLLTKAAMLRVAEEWISIFRSHVPDDDAWAEVVDEIKPHLENLKL